MSTEHRESNSGADSDFRGVIVAARPCRMIETKRPPERQAVQKPLLTFFDFSWLKFASLCHSGLMLVFPWPSWTLTSLRARRAHVQGAC
jgi:hypothetical protein